MTHGPCAGVGDDGSCEVPAAGACAFLGLPDAAWPYPASLTGADADLVSVAVHPAVAAFRDAARTRPVVVADLPTSALSADSLRASAGALAGAADACLLGDHPGARVQFPPSYRVRLLADAGVPAWAGINARDRNRVALEGEIAACLDAGAVGLHCVTGDHPALGTRADAPGVFDLDSVGLVALAAQVVGGATGACRSVAHAPAALPWERRLPRLLAKIEAGADTVFVDHCGGPGPVADAVGALRDAGFTGLVLVCVPVAASPGSAAVLAGFAGTRLPPGYLARITGAEGGGPSPHSPTAAAEIAAAGVDEGTDLAERMLEIPGVDGVNLSGGTLCGEEAQLAAAMAEISRRVRGVSAPGRRRGPRAPVAGRHG
jgi:hypothetical protein